MKRTHALLLPLVSAVAMVLATGCAGEESAGDDADNLESELAQNAEFAAATEIALNSRNDVPSAADDFVRVRFKATKGNVLRIYIPESSNAQLLKGSTGEVVSELSALSDVKLTSSGTFFLRSRNNQSRPGTVSTIFLTQQNNAEHKAFMSSVACQGPAVTFETFAKAMRRGRNLEDLRSTVGGGRKRRCNTSTGCSAWETHPTSAQFVLRTTNDRLEFSQGLLPGLANVRVGDAEIGKLLENHYLYPAVRMTFRASKSCLSMTTDAPSALSPTESVSYALRFDIPDVAVEEREPAFSSACAGTALSNAEIFARFAPGSDTLSFESATTSSRSRICNRFTGCSAWDAPARDKPSSAYSLHATPDGRLEVWVNTTKKFDVVAGTILENTTPIGVVSASCVGFVRSESKKSSEQILADQGQFTENWTKLNAPLP